MIKEHSHDTASPVLSCLFPIAIVRSRVDEVRHAAKDGQAGIIVALSRVAVQQECQCQAGHVPTETPHSDQIRRDPGWKQVNDEITKRTLNIGVIETVTGAFRPMIYDLFVELRLDIGAI